MGGRDYRVKVFNCGLNMLRKLLIALGVLIIIALIYIPVINGFKDAFLTDNNTPTLTYLSESLSRNAIQRSLRVTLLQATASTIISVIGGTLVAIALAFKRIPGESIIKSLNLLAFMAPVMVVVTGFTILYGTGGLLVRVFPATALLGHGFWGIVAAHVFYNTPLAALYVYTSLTSIPREIIHTVVLFSKGKTKLLFDKIILPYIIQPALTASIIIFTYCFTSFAIPLSIGGIRYSTLEVYIYRYYRISLDPHSAAAVAFIQYIPLQVLSLLMILLLMRRKGRAPPVGGFKYELTLPRSVSIFLQVFVYLEAIYILLPLLVVPYYSLIDPYTRVLSLKAYGNILNPTYDPGFGVPMLTIYVNTVYYAFMALILGVSIAFILAFFTPAFSDILYLSLLAISPLTLSLGLLRTYSMIVPIPLIIVLAHIIAGLPLTVRLLRMSAERISKQYLGLARLFHVLGLKLFFWVELPLLKPAVLSASLLALVISLGEFSATYFIATTQYSTLSVSIQLLRGLRKWQEASAAATLLLVLTGILTLIANRRGVKWRM
jgi:thiamine transport system permease protein